MKFQKNFLTALLIVLSSGLYKSSAQGLNNIILDNKISLLNERAFMSFPTGSKTEMYSKDFNDRDLVTKVMFYKDDFVLMFIAKEIYKTGGNNLLTQVTNEKTNFANQSKILFDKESVLTIISTPTKFDTSSNTVKINSLLVRMPDNTIFVVNAYINKDAFKIKGDFIKLSENVFKSLTKGTRVVNLSAHIQEVSLAGSSSWDGWIDKSLVINLPVNYYIADRVSGYTQYIDITKFVDYGDTAVFDLQISGGRTSDVDYTYSWYGFSESDAIKSAGVFLGKKTEWFYFQNAGANFYYKEQVFAEDKIEEDFTILVTMESSLPATIEEMTKVIETIKVVKN